MTLKEIAAKYWDEAAGVVLTVFLALNSAYGWLPAEVVAVIVAAAGSVGIVVFKWRDADAKAKADLAEALAHGAHNRLDVTESNAGILPMRHPDDLPSRPDLL